MLETRRIRHVGGRIDDLVFVAGHEGLELHRRYCRDNCHVKLTFQALLHNFHVQHAQKSTAEAEAQCRGCFLLPNKGGIVELQLFHGSTQLLKFGGVYRINTRKNHGLHVFKAFDGF